ncbi:MAG: hypothetical protein JNM33_02730 [Rubrivivax sp.]|nr:hypothetical protein [Rubrivivax sp.]
MRQPIPLLAACALAALLTACGDDPAQGPEAPPSATASEVPSTAAANAATWTQYAASLPRSETAAPLGLNQVTPPTSETEAPVAF